MRLIILLAMLVIGLPFIISQVAMPYGIAVSLRFLERPTNSEKPKYTIPFETDKTVNLTEDSLTKWTGMKGGRLAQGYATRVIPLDLLYLLFFGRVSRVREHNACRHNPMAGEFIKPSNLGVLASASPLYPLRLCRGYIDPCAA